MNLDINQYFPERFLLLPQFFSVPIKFVQDANQNDLVPFPVTEFRAFKLLFFKKLHADGVF